MTIEITSMQITDRNLGTVRMTGVDVSEERLQYFERYRDDGFEKELVYSWQTTDPKQFYALRQWMKKQKAATEAATFGEAMKKIIGTVTDSPAGRFRVWEE